MTKFDEMDGGKPAACEVCEAMLPDAVDGLLSAEEKPDSGGPGRIADEDFGEHDGFPTHAQ